MFHNCCISNHKSSFLRRNLTFSSLSGMSSQTFFLSTICLNAKGKIGPHFAIRYLILFMQHLELKSILFASLVVSVQNVSLLLCFPYQGMANHLPLLFISRWQQSSSFMYEYCVSRADQDLSTTTGLDKLVLCGVGQMVLLFIFSVGCVLKEQYESYCWQEEHQLLLDTLRFYNVLKETAWYYELRKESDDSCCVCSDCPPLSFEVTNWIFANAAKPYIHRFFSPHHISASSDDISSRWHSTYWKCLTCNIFHECTLWSSWQQVDNMYSGSLLCAITKRQFKLMLICRNVYLLKYLKRAFFWDFWTK